MMLKVRLVEIAKTSAGNAIKVEIKIGKHTTYASVYGYDIPSYQFNQIAKLEPFNLERPIQYWGELVDAEKHMNFDRDKFRIVFQDDFERCLFRSTQCATLKQASRIKLKLAEVLKINYDNWNVARSFSASKLHSFIMDLDGNVRGSTATDKSAKQFMAA